MDIQKWLASARPSDVSDYISFKENCFSCNLRICENSLDDEQHRRCRRITGHFPPAKPCEQRAARAIEHLGKNDGLGPDGVSENEDSKHLQVWDCDAFMTALRIGVRDLLFEPSLLDTCADCKGVDRLLTRRQQCHAS